MMAAVFLMQPVGQLAVSTMSLLALMIFGKSHVPTAERNHTLGLVVIDRMWRLIVIVNAVPAFITFVARFTSSESPQYILEVGRNHSFQSKVFEVQNIAALDISRNEVEDTTPGSEIGIGPIVASNERTVDGLEMIGIQHEPKPKQLSYNGIMEYFWDQGNWRRLVGTSMCWFLFGIAYSGLGINNSRVLAQAWTHSPLAISGSSIFSPVDPPYSNGTTYEALLEDSIHIIITLSSGNLLGSIILATVIDYVPRKKMLVLSFVSLAVLFAIAGGYLFNGSTVDVQPLEVALYITCQILCNLGKFLFASSTLQALT